MIIPENKFSPIAITLSLSDIGINTEKALDTTAEIGGGIPNILYLPINDEEKLLSQISDIVEEIAIANGYYNYHYKCCNIEMTFEETNEAYPNVFPIAYNSKFYLEYSTDGTAELQVWIEPKNPDDTQYLDDNMVFENIPVTLENEDMKYLLNVFFKIIAMEMI